MQSYLRASPVRGTSTSLFVQGTIPRDFRGRTSTLRGCVTEILVLRYRLLLALCQRLDSVDDRQILDLLECVGKNAPSPAYRTARGRTNVCLRSGKEFSRWRQPVQVRQESRREGYSAVSNVSGGVMFINPTNIFLFMAEYVFRFTRPC